MYLFIPPVDEWFVIDRCDKHRNPPGNCDVSNASIYHSTLFCTSSGSPRTRLSKKKIQRSSTSPYEALILKIVWSTISEGDDCLTIALDVDSPQSHPSTVYDLIANVTHESVAGTTRDKENTVWKAHLRAASGGGEGEKWFQIQDLIVEETRKEMIFLGETVLQGSSFEFSLRESPGESLT
jgi:hypothetical protein